jgi:sigma-E factor negative regulatory protein RseB
VVKRFFLVLLLSTRTVFAADLELNARQALTKMTHAMRVLNYQGTVAFLRNGKLETMKYFHAAEEGIEQERLLSLNSPLREIIRDANKVSCLFKSTQQVVVDHRPVGRSFLVDLPQNLDELSAIYDFEIVGEENVAMLPAYVVAIQPKDDFRYVRKIWIEQQQFLPLKVAVYDLSDTILEQVVFTDLQVKETLPFVEVKFGEASGAVKHIHQLQPQASDKAAFVINSLPSGFQEIFFTRRPMHNSNQPVDHLLLSDGFAAVSIYMENKNTTIQQGLQAVGAINSYSRTIDDWQLTVMGEVPAKTVKFIAEGIKLRPSNN